MLRFYKNNYKHQNIPKILTIENPNSDFLIRSMNECRICRVMKKPWIKKDVINILNNTHDDHKESKTHNDLLSRLMESEAETKRNENLYRTLAKNIPNFAVIIFDEDFKYLLADGTALDNSGFENIEGMTMYDVMSPETVEQILPTYKRILEKGENLTTEHERKGKWYESQFIPIRNDDMEIDMGMIVVYETTNIKKLSIELEKNNMYLDNFIYAASHDLKSPVANLKAMVDMWKIPNIDKVELNSRIKDTTYLLDKTLSSLIEILDIQKNNKKDYKKTSFKVVYNSVLKLLEKHMKQSNPNIQTNFEVKNINYIEVYLQSIIQNLLSNSMKYFSDSRDCNVTISTEKIDDYILLKVKDNGIGMDLETIGDDKIFEPFNRFSRKSKGKGIGLHIVKNMVEKNGGYIEVDSHPNKGTTFYIYLKEY